MQRYVVLIRRLRRDPIASVDPERAIIVCGSAFVKQQVPALVRYGKALPVDVIE